MVQIRENRQKQSISHHADAGLLRTDLALGAIRMFVCIINVLGVKDDAP